MVLGGESAASLELHDAKLRIELVRFRLGAHGLGVVSGAWKDGGRLSGWTGASGCADVAVLQHGYSRYSGG